MSARGRLAEELREHALVHRRGDADERAKAQYYVDAKRAILRRPASWRSASCSPSASREWDATAVGGMTMGADAVTCAALAGGADVKGFFVRKEAKSHGLSRRIEGPLLDAGGPLPRRRGRRQHRRLDDRGDRGPAGGRPRDLRRRQRARPSRRRRRADRGRRGRAVRRARHDRRHLSRAPGPLSSRRASLLRIARKRAAAHGVEVDPDDEQVGAHRAHAGAFRREIERSRARGSSPSSTCAVPVRQRPRTRTRTRGSASMLRT